MTPSESIGVTKTHSLLRTGRRGLFLQKTGSNNNSARSNIGRSSSRIRSSKPSKKTTLDITWGLKRIAAGILLVGLFSVVVSHIVIDELQLKIDTLNLRSATISSKVVELRYKEAEMEAPQRIVASAENLGMISPANVTYLTPLVLSPTFLSSSSFQTIIVPTNRGETPRSTANDTSRDPRTTTSSVPVK